MSFTKEKSDEKLTQKHFGAVPGRHGTQGRRVGPGGHGSRAVLCDPSWNQTLPAATRFIVLTNMNSEAVLDRETGLVWEKEPGVSARDWRVSSTHCTLLSLGGRKGWRLPTIQDLASLIDPAVAFPGPVLPSGHPFIGIHLFPYGYWSSTSAFNTDPAGAWTVFFNNGTMGSRGKFTDTHIPWCVRGGQGADPQ